MEEAPNKLEEVKEKIERFRSMLDQVFLKADSLSAEIESLKS